MYEVLLERGAEKDLKELPAEVFGRTIRAIRALSQVPRPPGSRKLTGSKNDWRIRIGDYRAIYEINDNGKQVRVFRIRHRKEVYRGR